MSNKAFKKCSVPICQLPAKRRGWCDPHYSRWYKTGDVRADDPILPPPEGKRIEIRCHGCEKVLSLLPWEIGGRETIYCNNKCRLAFIAAQKTCERCGAPCQKASQRFCSNRCYNEDRAERTHVQLTCAWCGKQWTGRPCEAEKKYCSRTCHSEFQRTLVGPDHFNSKPKIEITCKVCRVIFEVSPSRELTAQFCSFACHAAWKQANSPRISSIEEIVAVELGRRNILFDRQIRVGRFFPDFLVGDTIVEVDGDYWHTLPDVMDRDERKNQFYKDQGFSVIRIWEHEIKAADFSKLESLAS